MPVLFPSIMLAVFEQYIRDHQMIEQGDIVCAGLSGGADSVCMVRMLCSLRRKLGFELRAFHVDHHLRGEESEGDRAFVQNLCKELDIPLTLFEHPVSEIAARWHKGLEETGRILRRQDAKKCLDDGCTRIALAHHQNDRAETMIFNMTRGCSLRGLAGIRPVNGAVIHPLLCFRKDQILEWMQSGGYDFREDSTNKDTAYTRNYLRERVIPDLEQNVNKETVLHFAQLADDMEQISAFLEKERVRLEERHILPEENRIAVRESLLFEEPYLVRSVLLHCLEILSGHSRDLHRRHAEDMVSLFGLRTGAVLCMPYGITAERMTDGIMLLKPGCFPDRTDNVQPEDFGVVPLIPGTRQRAGLYCIVSEWITDPEPLIREKNPYTKCFDYDIINKDCVFRTRRPGDRLVIDAEGHTQKLKDYMIRQKIPQPERSGILLMASGSRVHWIIGGRMSENVKVTNNTKRILAVTAVKENHE